MNLAAVGSTSIERAFADVTKEFEEHGATADLPLALLARDPDPETRKLVAEILRHRASNRNQELANLVREMAEVINGSRPPLDLSSQTIEAWHRERKRVLGLATSKGLLA